MIAALHASAFVVKARSYSWGGKGRGWLRSLDGRRERKCCDGFCGIGSGSWAGDGAGGRDRMHKLLNSWKSQAHSLGVWHCRDDVVCPFEYDIDANQLMRGSLRPEERWKIGGRGRMSVEGSEANYGG